MTLLLELGPDEEAQLRERAARRGQPAEEYALTVLRRDFERDTQLPQEASQEKPARTVAEMLGDRIGRLNSSKADMSKSSPAEPDAENQRLHEALANILLQAENLERQPPVPHTDPHEIAFGEIMREKYRKQGFHL